MPNGFWVLLGPPEINGPLINNCNTIQAGISYDITVTIKCANGPGGLLLNFGGAEFFYDVDGVFNETVVAIEDCLLRVDKTDGGWEGGIEVTAVLT